MSEPKVEYNYLGRSGVRVSNICLGAMTFGETTFDFPNQASEELSFQIMDRYKELGGNFIDTANIYGRGCSEQVVGNWLHKNNRDKMIIATKVRFQMDPDDVNAVGLSRRHIIQSCEQSLERLQTPYIDLLQSHMWDHATPIDETLRTFDDLIRCGKVRYFGCSNVCGWQLQKIVDHIKFMGLSNCITLQQQYNLMCRQPEFEELMVCKNEGIGVLPWSPLKGGILTGKFKKDEKPDGKGSRIGYVHQDESKATQASPAWSEINKDESYWKLIDVMRSICEAHGKTIPQVAIRWLIQRDVVCSVIMGATSVKQMEDNMGASAGWSLTKEEMGQLTEASTRINLYPYDIMWRPGATRVNKFNLACDLY